MNSMKKKDKLVRKFNEYFTERTIKENYEETKKEFLQILKESPEEVKKDFFEGLLKEQE